MTVAFYSSFCKCAKRGRKIRKKKTKKLSQFLKSHISGTLEAISLKFGMWGTEVGGNVHSKNHLVSSRQHKATEVRKLRFLSSCQYTHGCYAPASWAAQHTTVCLDYSLLLPSSTTVPGHSVDSGGNKYPVKRFGVGLVFVAEISTS